MENETHANNVFEFEKCRARKDGGDLIDCLFPEQAHLCGYSLSFGYGYFCKNPRRDEIMENTKKLRSKLVPPPDVSQSDNQE